MFFAPPNANEPTRSTNPNAMSDFVKVANFQEIPRGGSKLVEVETVRVALFNLEGEIYAIEDVCTHDGGPLVEGTVVDDCLVQCPRHGARFDIRTGAAVRFPAFEPTQTFQVRVENDAIWMQRPE